MAISAWSISKTVFVLIEFIQITLIATLLPVSSSKPSQTQLKCPEPILSFFLQIKFQIFFIFKFEFSLGFQSQPQQNINQYYQKNLLQIYENQILIKTQQLQQENQINIPMDISSITDQSKKVWTSRVNRPVRLQYIVPAIQTITSIINGTIVTCWIVLHPQFNTSDLKKIQDEIKQAIEGQIKFIENVQEFANLLKQNHRYSWRLLVDQNLFEDIKTRINSNQLQKVDQFILVSSKNYLKMREPPCFSNLQIFSCYQDALKNIKDRQYLMYAVKNAGATIFPMFMILQSHPKAFINNYRINLHGLLTLNSEELIQSRQRFFEYTSSIKNKHQIKKEVYKRQCNLNNFYHLKLYVQNNLFYSTINNTLRLLLFNEVSNFFTIGQPFNKLYYSIKSQFKIQASTKSQWVKKKLYRGTCFSNSQIQELKKNVGKYIQNFGFLSTSLSPSVAKDFMEKYKMINPIQLIIDISDYCQNSYPQQFFKLEKGFVYINNLLTQQQNQNYRELEVLFNAMNIFKIEKVDDKQIYLKWVPITTIMQIKNEQKVPNLSEQECSNKQIRTINSILQSLALNVNSFGDTLIQSNNLAQAQRYYRYKLSKLPKKSKQWLQCKLKLGTIYQRQSKYTQAKDIFLQILDHQSTQQCKKQSKQHLAEIYSLSQDLDKIEKLNYSVGLQLQYSDVQNNQKLKIQYLFQWSNILSKEFGINKKFGILQNQQILLKQIQKNLLQIQNKEQYLTPQQRKLLFFKQIELYEQQIYFSQLFPKQNLYSVQDVRKKLSEKKSFMESYIELQNQELSILKRRQLQIEFFNFTNLKEEQMEAMNLKMTDFRNQMNETFQKIKKIDITQIEKLNQDIQLYSQIVQKQVPTQQSYDSSIKTIDSAFRLLLMHRPQTHQEIYNIENQLALCQKHYRNYQKGITRLQKVSEKQGQHHTVFAKTQYNLGLLYFDNGDRAKAYECYIKARQIYQNILGKKYKKSIHCEKIQISIAILYRDCNLYYYIQQQPTNWSYAAKLANLKGLQFLHSGKFNQSISQFEKSIKKYQQNGSDCITFLGDVNCNLSIVEQLVVNNRKENYFNKPEEKSYDDFQNQIKIQQNKIDNRIKIAEKIFKHNVFPKDSYVNHPLRAKIQWYIGIIEKLRSNYIEAISHFQICIQINNIYEKGCVVNELASKMTIYQCMIKEKEKEEEGQKTFSEKQIKNYLQNLKAIAEKEIKKSNIWDLESKTTEKKNKILQILKIIYKQTHQQRISLIET